MRRMLSPCNAVPVGGQLIFAGVATGADPSRFTADPAHAGLDVRRGQIHVRSHRKERRRSSGGPTPPRVKVMIKYDYDGAQPPIRGVKVSPATSLERRASPEGHAAAVRPTRLCVELSNTITARAEKAVPA